MSIRLRLALGFAIASAMVLSLGAWLFVSVLSSSLLNSVDSQLATQASHASSYLGAGSNVPLTAPGANGPEYVVQVVDASGKVRGSSAEAPAVPIISAGEADRARTQRVLITQTRNNEHERVLAQPLPGRGGWIVIVGASLETYDATMSRVTTELVIGCTLFVILAAAGSYLLARSALKPVERLRAEVSDLSVRDIPGTIAVPRTHDEMSALAQTMNELLVRVRTSLEREQSLVADASHELRTPFAILQGELELAQRPGRTREELMTTVTVAAEEVTRLTRIADDLLLLSRGDQGQLRILPVEVSLRDYLDEIISHAEPRLTGHGMTCRIDAPSDLRVRIDSDRIRQVIDNLIDNSLRYCPHGSEVNLRAGAMDQDLWLEVADNGPGFDPTFLPHAFERFRRSDTSRSRDHGGAGLGLAIVSSIVVAHGGTVIAENRPTGGACVRVTLRGAVWPSLRTDR
jgi:two-component system OmpR family sensor kinase